MQWSEPGHEFDMAYEERACAYQDKNIVIYGAGMIGGRIYDAVSKLSSLTVTAFFDSDKSKTEYKHLPVYDKEELKKYADSQNTIMIIGLPDETGRKIRDELVSVYGFDQALCKLYSEFIMYDFPIITLYQRNKVFLDTVSMIVTEECTLRCEKCSIMLPYFGEVRPYPLNKLKQEADILFDKVDFIGNFTLTGGEPLLNRELVSLIRYIGEKYRLKIGSFKIITNGTMIPSNDLLHAMQRYDMAVEISDYTSGVPEIKGRVEQTKELFEKSGIKTYLLSAMQWVDFGFETVNHNYSVAQLQRFFDSCHTRCRGYVDGKIRYCINAYFSERTLYGTEDDNNSFDIRTMNHSQEDRKRLVEFDLGFNETGFLKMCRHCNGTIEINQHFIEVGKQCVNH